jgi:hypothetical protein
MFDDDEDGGKWIPSDNEYYGEVVLTLPIKRKEQPLTGCTSTTTLQNAAFANGLQAELILEGEHYDFLAKLSIRNKEKKTNNSYILERKKKPNNKLLFGFFIYSKLLRNTCIYV